MPGRNLNNTERNLLRFWNSPPDNLAQPLLRSIAISGGNGLRGLNEILVPFHYPVTAICGKNGSGKSTILALAALAHHSPPLWHVHWTNTRYRRSRAAEDCSYYIFPDFFPSGPDEQIPDGVRITWRYYSNGAETQVIFNKSKGRWGKYKRRPERAVTYAPLSRLLPAQELNTLRRTFAVASPQATSQHFSEAYRQHFSYVMGANYRDVEILKTDRLTFAKCKTDISYSGFNMGSGENCVAHLLYLLDSLPAHGLLIVEEVESCLHPEAQMRLAEVFVKISKEKRIQIICSTHSEVFLDALPREARLLFRSGTENPVIENPSTRFAVYEMKGNVQPELTVYCEDYVAATLVEEAIPYEDRIRLKILDIGSKNTVIKQGVSHLRGSFPGGCLCILDGDATQNEIDTWIKSEANDNKDIVPDTEILPGNAYPPESWVLAQLAHASYRDEFANQLGCGRTEAAGHITAMSAVNHHDMAFTLSQRIGFDQEECIRRIMRSVAPQHPELDKLRMRIKELIN